MPTQFPQELLEELIDYLVADSVSLKTCSLVSRAWVLRSRSHLFATCTLTPTNIRPFCDLLRASTFLPHVRIINASTDYWTQSDRYSNETAADLRRLTGVRALIITLNFLTTAASADAAFCTGLAMAFPSITNLDITCRCEGYHSEAQSPPLFDLISLFPTLQELSVNAVARFPQIMHAPPMVVPPPGLRRVCVGMPVAQPILRWLHVANHLPNLEAIILPFLQWHEESMIRSQLRQLSGIHTLNICVSVSDDDPTTIFNLALHPNLKTLGVTIFAGRGDLGRLIPLLSTLPTPALIEHFSLALHPHSIKTFEWGPLDEFLSPTRFPRLRSVVLTGHKSTDKTLPLLAARGLIQV
ncbi:hypothetical protein C8F04DRAFT_1253631 [Mycena alexandri]|uniref:F-box domain-containing protein n=1 Tax=Mycena alexandri TaxID=1745969 RepID=A0AAD6T781_9AGAR|nr:hypothetical protein C8F04DRAFT_1253631 [Mycena alexandri]